MELRLRNCVLRQTPRLEEERRRLGAQSVRVARKARGGLRAQVSLSTVGAFKATSTMHLSTHHPRSGFLHKYYLFLMGVRGFRESKPR